MSGGGRRATADSQGLFQLAGRVDADRTPSARSTRPSGGQHEGNAMSCTGASRGHRKQVSGLGYKEPEGCNKVSEGMIYQGLVLFWKAPKRARGEIHDV